MIDGFWLVTPNVTCKRKLKKTARRIENSIVICKSHLMVTIKWLFPRQFVLYKEIYVSAIYICFWISQLNAEVYNVKWLTNAKCQYDVLEFLKYCNTWIPKKFSSKNMGFFNYGIWIIFYKFFLIILYEQQIFHLA